jgi:two-component system cell cycle sensor histidine kinase/response regulator CckA
VRELLTFAQRDRAEPRPVDLNEIVGGMEPLLRRTLGEHIHLQITMSEIPAQVIGDPTHLEQVILNLAVNARDAMPDGGVLWIATAIDRDEETASDDRVVLSVTDTGEGIADEVRARMFEPFVTSKAPGKGTGLGLATVQSIVKRLGGEIDVLTKIGEGTTFEVSLARCSASADRARAREAESRFDGARRRVLLVEDDESVRFALARLLQRLDFVVTTAVDGADALQMVEQHGFDLVITDAVMPGLPGPQLVEHLRSARPELPVLLMSGYTPGESQHTEASGVPRLRKPFTISDLTRALGLVLDDDAARQPVT